MKKRRVSSLFFGAFSEVWFDYSTVTETHRSRHVSRHSYRRHPHSHTTHSLPFIFTLFIYFPPEPQGAKIRNTEAKNTPISGTEGGEEWWEWRGGEEVSGGKEGKKERQNAEQEDERSRLTTGVVSLTGPCYV